MQKLLVLGLCTSFIAQAAEMTPEELVARRARIAAYKAAAKANGTYDPRSEKYRDGLLAAANVQVVPTPAIVITPEQFERGNRYMAMRREAFIAASITNQEEYTRVRDAAQKIADRKQQGMFVSRQSSAFLEGAQEAFRKFHEKNSESK